MSRQLVEERPTAVDTPHRRRPMEWADLWNAFPAGTWVAAAAAVRGAVVAVTGIVATVSLAVVVWAITPQSGNDATAALHAGFAALAAGNLLPLSIGGIRFTLSPLLVTLLLGLLLCSTARRGRFRPAGRAQEILVTLVGGGVYGLLVLMLTRGLGDEGVVSPGVGPFVVGILGFGIGTLGRESAWRAWWRSIVPPWVTVALRAAVVGTVALIGGAAALFAVSLALHFGSALTVDGAVAPNRLDGAGLTVLSLVYLPNVVLGAVGYSVGAGVQVGPGSYRPWGASAAELPGLPFLAALPTPAALSVALVAVVVPVAAAGLLGWTVVRGGLPTRWDRTLAAVTAAVTSAVVVGLAVFVAGGGVGTGRWAVIGSPAPIAAAAVAVGFAVVGSAITVLTAVRTVPWRIPLATPRVTARRSRSRRRPAGATRRSADGDGSADPGGAAVDDSDRDAPLADSADDHIDFTDTAADGGHIDSTDTAAADDHTEASDTSAPADGADETPVVDRADQDDQALDGAADPDVDPSTIADDTDGSATADPPAGARPDAADEAAEAEPPADTAAAPDAQQNAADRPVDPTRAVPAPGDDGARRPGSTGDAAVDGRGPAT